MTTAETKKSETQRFGRYDGIRMTTVFISSEDYLVYRLQRSSDTGRESDVYSVLVSLYRKGKLTDEEFVPDIARNKERADRIFSLLYENSVTPSTLYESVDAIFDIV